MKRVTVSELNNRVNERAYQESLRGKYEVWSGGEIESVEKDWEEFRDGNGVLQRCIWHETCGQAEKKGE